MQNVHAYGFEVLYRLCPRHAVMNMSVPELVRGMVLQAGSLNKRLDILSGYRYPMFSNGRCACVCLPRVRLQGSEPEPIQGQTASLAAHAALNGAALCYALTLGCIGPDRRHGSFKRSCRDGVYNDRSAASFHAMRSMRLRSPKTRTTRREPRL